MELFIPTFPEYEELDGGKRARLLSDYHFAIDGVDYVIKRGFEWDGASIPKLMRWKYGSPFDLVHIIGGLVHDSIYANEIYYSASSHRADFMRLEADNIYFALIHKMGATVLRAFKEWLAVVICGWLHWKKR